MPSTRPLGLPTPPATPIKKADRYGRASDPEVLVENGPVLGQTDHKTSLSRFDWLSPPTTPEQKHCSPRTGLRPVQCRQLDGQGGSLDTPPHVPSTSRASLSTASDDELEPIRSGRELRHTDLTLPDNCPFPSPNTNVSVISTPLTRAVPATGAFPFPAQPRSTVNLSRLSLRGSRRASAPSQARSPNTPSHSRRLSVPDRFIPGRPLSTNLNQEFRLAKSPQQLSPEERATRHRTPGSDPFRQDLRRPTNRVQTSIPTRTRAVNPARANTTPAGVHPGDGGPTARRQSQGSVWNIGNVASAPEGVVPVHDGRGGLLGSGTNAPLHTARFLTKTDALRELEVYERRLALAFEVDQTTRILGSLALPELTNASSNTGISSPHSPSPMRCRQPVAGVEWRDSQWSQEGSPSSSATHLSAR